MTATTDTGVENPDKDLSGQPAPTDPNATPPAESSGTEAPKSTGVEPHDNGQPHVQTKELPTN